MDKIKLFEIIKKNLESHIFKEAIKNIDKAFKLNLSAQEKIDLYNKKWLALSSLKRFDEAEECLEEIELIKESLN